MTFDIRVHRKDLYRPSTREFVEVNVPPMTYLGIDGHGDPNTSTEYAAALAALYPAAYATKFAHRARTGGDFVVGPLEGLWSSTDPAAFAARHKDDWDWTMLIPIPDTVSPADIDRALSTARAKKPTAPIDHVQVRHLSEGRCLQIMHLGPFDTEGPTLARLHDEIMPSRGLTWNGPHHEIYLTDPRRTAPDRQRTVLRQPVRSVT